MYTVEQLCLEIAVESFVLLSPGNMPRIDFMIKSAHGNLETLIFTQDGFNPV